MSSSLSFLYFFNQKLFSEYLPHAVHMFRVERRTNTWSLLRKLMHLNCKTEFNLRFLPSLFLVNRHLYVSSESQIILFIKYCKHSNNNSYNLQHLLKPPGYFFPNQFLFLSFYKTWPIYWTGHHSLVCFHILTFYMSGIILNFYNFQVIFNTIFYLFICYTFKITYMFSAQKLALQTRKNPTKLSGDKYTTII